VFDLFILAAVVFLSLALMFAVVWGTRLSRVLNVERSRRQSLSTRYGLLTEQFLPLVTAYPWNPANFRFLGSPIDGIQFEEGEIIVVEFKAGNSQLTKTQKRIRDLVSAGKVRFEVVRIG
jgi:predicted Holliday junction resolvase-like endonuclease